jgi:hypothetical protein
MARKIHSVEVVATVERFIGKLMFPNPVRGGVSVKEEDGPVLVVLGENVSVIVHLDGDVSQVDGNDLKLLEGDV